MSTTSRQQAPLFFGGLDLGQATDYSALAIVERTDHPDPDKPGRMLGHYVCGELRRFQLGTSYTAIVDALRLMYEHPPLKGTALAPDYTGCGRPVIDMLYAARLNAVLRPVTLTAGLAVTMTEDGGYHVPKRTLCAVLQLLLQSRRLRIAASLPEAATLTRELTTFKVKITTAGNETYEAWRENDKDDLVLALGFAVFLGENYHGWDTPSSIPNPPPPRVPDKHPFPYKQPHGREHSRKLYGRAR